MTLILENLFLFSPPETQWDEKLPKIIFIFDESWKFISLKTAYKLSKAKHVGMKKEWLCRRLPQKFYAQEVSIITLSKLEDQFYGDKLGGYPSSFVIWVAYTSIIRHHLHFNYISRSVKIENICLSVRRNYTRIYTSL